MVVGLVLIVRKVGCAVWMGSFSPSMRRACWFTWSRQAGSTGIGIHEWLGLGVLVVFFAHAAMHVRLRPSGRVRSAFARPSWARTGNLTLDLLIVAAFTDGDGVGDHGVGRSAAVRWGCTRTATTSGSAAR